MKIVHLGLGNGISDISVIAVQWYEYLPRRAWMRSGVGWFADEAKLKGGERGGEMTSERRPHPPRGQIRQWLTLE